MGLQAWVFRIALAKIVKRLILLIVAFVSSENISKLGITVDPNPLTVGIYAGLELARNYIKTKFNLKHL